MGVAQNQRDRVTQVLVFGSIYQGANLVHPFEPQPHVEGRPHVPLAQPIFSSFAATFNDASLAAAALEGSRVKPYSGVAAIEGLALVQIETHDLIVFFILFINPILTIAFSYCSSFSSFSLLILTMPIHCNTSDPIGQDKPQPSALCQGCLPESHQSGSELREEAVAFFLAAW